MGKTCTIKRVLCDLNRPFLFLTLDGTENGVVARFKSALEDEAGLDPYLCQGFQKLKPILADVLQVCALERVNSFHMVAAFSYELAVRGAVIVFDEIQHLSKLVGFAESLKQMVDSLRETPKSGTFIMLGSRPLEVDDVFACQMPLMGRANAYIGIEPFHADDHNELFKLLNVTDPFTQLGLIATCGGCPELIASVHARTPIINGMKTKDFVDYLYHETARPDVSNFYREEFGHLGSSILEAFVKRDNNGKITLLDDSTFMDIVFAVRTRMPSIDQSRVVITMSRLCALGILEARYPISPPPLSDELDKQQRHNPIVMNDLPLRTYICLVEATRQDTRLGGNSVSTADKVQDYEGRVYEEYVREALSRIARYSGGDVNGPWLQVHLCPSFT